MESKPSDSPPSAVSAPPIPPERHAHVRKILERPGPFTQEDFEPGESLFDFVMNRVRILVVGAGGLGCELLKDLAMTGFKQIHVIDMDTIDLSNLNRQFLFRKGDVGKSKAEVAAAFINKRVQGVTVVPHNCRIQEMDEAFYRSFHIIACGLDSIVARRWINSMVLSLVEYDAEGKPLQGEGTNGVIIPFVDGGTEGFQGNARVIIPGSTTPCIECLLELYPPQVNYPMCTIASTPRLPEHCVEYVRLLQWPKEGPFGGKPIDGDDPQHINWIFDKAKERADQFKITGVTYRLTQGVVKRIIPAVASTNAVIAGACATEVLKLATNCCRLMDNNMVFNDTDGIYAKDHRYERKEDCMACSRSTTTLLFSSDVTLKQVVDFLKESAQYQMKNPMVATYVNGKNRTLYTTVIKATEGNLSKQLTELNLADGQVITVGDETFPRPRDFRIVFTGAGAAMDVDEA